MKQERTAARIAAFGLAAIVIATMAEAPDMFGAIVATVSMIGGGFVAQMLVNSILLHREEVARALHEREDN